MGATLKRLANHKETILLKLSLVHGYFSRFLNYLDGTKLRKAYHMPCGLCAEEVAYSKCLAKFGENKLLHLKWANIEASAQLSSEKSTKLRVM